MLKEILENLNEAKISILKLKDLEKKLSEMQEDKLNDVIGKIFSEKEYDTFILMEFVQNLDYSDDIYNLSEKAKQKLWSDLQNRIEKALKKMKREDLLALKDTKTCVKEIKNELRDTESRFCTYVRDSIYREIGKKMFQDKYSELRYWMEEFKFFERMENIKDEDLCEIKKVGIEKVEIKDLGGDENISIATRASVFTERYEIIINNHIKFEVSKTEVDSI